MHLPTDQREKLFTEGRMIHARLGDAFQNDMDVEKEHLDMELESIAAVMRGLETYRANVVFLRDIELDDLDA
jgi:hypothetical protein